MRFFWNTGDTVAAREMRGGGDWLALVYRTLQEYPAALAAVKQAMVGCEK